MTESELHKQDKKSESNQIGFFEILLIALLTSIFTLVTSYFLLSSQLEQEQDYWSTRMKTERIQELMDRQIKLLEEVNSGILVSEVLAKDIKLEYVMLELSTQGLIDNSKDRGKLLNDKQVEYHKHFSF